MDKLMQSLFNYITDCTLEKYYEPTGVWRYWEERDAIGRAAVLQVMSRQTLRTAVPLEGQLLHGPAPSRNGNPQVPVSIRGYAPTPRGPRQKPYL